MRAAWLALVLVALALVLSLAGCGESEEEPARAGSEPVPSSTGASPNPVHHGAHQPMFPGPAYERRVARLSGTPLLREARRREDAEARAAGGPERLREDRAARGREIAAQMAAAAAERARDPEADECDHAWAARAALREGLEDEGAGAASAAEEEAFVRACRAMPEQDRQCLSALYFRDHVEECVAAQDATLARLRAEGHVGRPR